MRLKPKIAILALLAACARQKSSGNPPLRIAARLAQKSETTFGLSARLSRPVYRLPFTRPGDGDRLHSFRLVEPALARLESRGEEEEIASAEAFDRVVLDATVHRHHPEKNYAPFFPLSGGGVFVYTGQLDLGEQGSTLLEYDFEPRAGEFVIVPGVGASRGPLRFTAGHDGTYVAFVRAAPIEEARFIAVIDAGFPAGLRDAVRALLPPLFDHYAVALGEELPARPMVFLSYGDGPGSSVSITGGALPGLLQLDVQLGKSRWAQGDAEVLADFRRVVAHEAAHLWNNRPTAARGADWIHEGGADLLAWRALRKLGLSSAEQFSERLSWAASVCALLRGGEALDKDATGARYACGAIVQAVASNGEDPGIESVWKVLLENARRTGSADADAFFEACAEAGSPARAWRAARELAGADAAAPRARVVAALSQAGFAVQEGAPPPRFLRLASKAGKPGAPFLRVGYR